MQYQTKHLPVKSGYQTYNDIARLERRNELLEYVAAAAFGLFIGALFFFAMMGGR